MQTRSKSAATAEATKADSASAHDIQMDPVNPPIGVYDSSQTIQPDIEENIQSDDEAQPIDSAMEDEIKEMINEFEIYLTKKKMAKKAKKAQKKKEEDSKKGKGKKPDGDPSDSSDTEGGDRTPRGPCLYLHAVGPGNFWWSQWAYQMLTETGGRGEGFRYVWFPSAAALGL